MNLKSNEILVHISSNHRKITNENRIDGGGGKEFFSSKAIRNVGFLTFHKGRQIQNLKFPYWIVSNIHFIYSR